MNINKTNDEVLAQIVSKIGIQLLKSQKKDLMVIIENSNIPREEQFRLKKLFNNSIHNSYKILKNQIAEFAENKEKFFKLVAEQEDRERSKRYY